MRFSEIRNPFRPNRKLQSKPIRKLYDQRFRAPVFNLFKTASQLSNQVDYTGASARWDWNRSLALQEFASGVPRFGYSPERAEDGRGLLIHEATTLLDCEYSDDLSNAFWSQQEIVALSATIACPITGRDAYKVIPNAVNTAHSVRDTTPFTSGTNYVGQMIAKADDQRYVFIRGANNATWDCTAIFDLQTGTSYTLSGGSSGMIPLDDGWYLCWAEAPALASAVTNREFGVTDSNNSVGSTGDNVKGCYITGVNFFEGDTWKPYTYSNGSNVAVAADVVSTTDISWFTPSDGVTLYCEYEHTVNDLTNSLFSRVWEFNDGTSSNRIQLMKTSTGTISLRYGVSGVFNTAIEVPAIVGKNKVAATFSSSGMTLTVNGVHVSTSDSSYPTVTTFYVGRSFSGNYANSRYYDLNAYDRVWTEEEAIERTYATFNLINSLGQINTDLLDFTRASAGWDWDADLLLTEFASGAVRNGYSPGYEADGIGVLIEESIAQLQGSPIDVTGSNSTVDDLNLSMEASASNPLSEATIGKMEETLVNSTHYVQGNTVTADGSSTYTYKVLLKAGTAITARVLIVGGGVTTPEVIVDLTDGSVLVSAGTYEITEITYDGELYYIVSVSATSTISSALAGRIYITDGSTVTYLGTGKYLYVLARNLVAEPSPKSFVLSQTTKAADVLSTTDISWAYPELGLSFYIEILLLDTASGVKKVFEFHNGVDNAEFIYLYYNAGAIVFAKRDAGGTDGSISDSTADYSQVVKIACRFSPTGIALCVNGNYQEVANSTYPVGDLTTFNIGSGLVGSYMNARYYQFKAEKRIWTQSYMEQITT